MGNALATIVGTDYMKLVERFPLTSIRDHSHLAEAIAVLDHLLDQMPLTEGEELYLAGLTDLVESYEDRHVVMPRVSGVEMLRHLMEANDLRQKDLVQLLGTPSIVSEVLSGKRGLALSHIQKLSQHFGLPADVFLGPPSSDTTAIESESI